MKIKEKRCFICGARVTETEKTIKIKERILYYDLDGIWSNFKTAYLCSNYIAEIRKKVKNGV